MENRKKKVLRIATVPLSLDLLLKGQLRMLNEEYEVVAVSSPGKELEKVAGREGVRTVAVGMERRISLLKDLVSLCRLIKVIRRENPWMVHTVTPKAGLLGMMAAWVCGVPVRVHTFTGLVFPTACGLKRKILMATDRLTCACATSINPEGKGVMNDLKRFGITRRDMKIVGNGNINGIDLEFFCRTPEVMEAAAKWRKEGSFTFCFVGRIVGDKGMNELAEAFGKLVTEYPACSLLLVGAFEEKLDPVSPEVKAFFENCGQVEFVGWQDDIRPFLAASDVFVFPSYREGFPNVVIQAAAMGVPSIVTDINGCNEIICDGVNGVIVPSHDADRLYEAMKRMREDGEAWANMSRKARASVAERYERKYVWNEIKKFYAELDK